MMPKPPSESLILDRFKTPIGVAVLAIDSEGYLRSLDWEDFGDRQIRLLRRFGGDVDLVPGPSPAAILQSLGAYFDGDLAALQTIKWRSGGTDFQLQCWDALCAIPAGSTSTYGTQALRIERPRAVRAVGLANGCNPVGVVVPCHRVIGADGSLTGYGGGLWRKRWLLRHEGVAAFQEDHPDLFDKVDPALNHA